MSGPRMNLRSVAADDGRQRFLAGRATAERIDDEEIEALDFQESDPRFRIFVCRYPVVPVFIVISMVKLILLLAAFSFTVAQLVSRSSSNEITTFNRTSTSKMPKTVVDSGGVQKLSWASAIFYFEPSWWFLLAYLRLVVAIVAILSVFCGLIGVWRQDRRFVLATVAADFGLVTFILCYIALLAWHAVKYGDYFGFCIGGLTLLALLLISVMGLHAAIVAQKYLRSMRAFVAAASNRWPDAYDAATRVVDRRIAEQRGCFANVFNRLTRRYATADELRRVTCVELASMNRSRIILHDIEEDDGEGNENQQPA